MIIDAHAHAWRRWPHLPPVPDPDTRGTMDQLIHQMDQTAVDQAVVICARVPDNSDNNEYVAEQAIRFPGRLHPFPDIDSYWTETYHTAGAASRLRSASAHARPLGFAHFLADQVDPWLTSDDGLELLETATELHQILSLWAPAPWLPVVERLAARFPSLPILLHHLGGASATAGPASPVLGQLAAMAKHANVFVKVSGFYYGSSSDWDFPFPDTISMVRTLYRALGSGRMCWGSDFPVCAKSVTYRQAIEVVRAHCRFMGSTEIDAVMGGTIQGLLTRDQPGLDSAT